MFCSSFQSAFFNGLQNTSTSLLLPSHAVSVSVLESFGSTPRVAFFDSVNEGTSDQASHRATFGHHFDLTNLPSPFGCPSNTNQSFTLENPFTYLENTHPLTLRVTPAYAWISPMPDACGLGWGPSRRGNNWASTFKRSRKGCPP